jgi:hypothetical protein
MNVERALDLAAHYIILYWWLGIPAIIAIGLFAWRSTLTGDARRNFLSSLTERLAFEPRAAYTLFDLRIGFTRQGVWKIARLYALQRVKQNFWNAMFALQIYVTIPRRFPLPFPRVALSCRYSESAWFQTHIGWLFDRGEFAVKFVFSNLDRDKTSNPGQWAVDGDPSTVTALAAKAWEEGGI